uniref:Uncharacterized protein n=1 Tax=Ralstonia solanacearum TaxID=305 RepID=A0A0S4U2C2_RALSL|nr:protein of unknown function [Ralstonia solanacearum]CUV26265.1 protein of unknown function [Ralstonia solanacearum]CUV30992.1 protein of unknown function [Ralstonia solanacearum]CUV37606.1 protein of unknown function [Ralstonia solanacearum]CUV63145.1 protein of unknown function [Ralstonia solanacearum]
MANQTPGSCSIGYTDTVYGESVWFNTLQCFGRSLKAGVVRVYASRFLLMRSATMGQANAFASCIQAHGASDWRRGDRTCVGGHA